LVMTDLFSFLDWFQLERLENWEWSGGLMARQRRKQRLKQASLSLNRSFVRLNANFSKSILFGLKRWASWGPKQIATFLFLSKIKTISFQSQMWASWGPKQIATRTNELGSPSWMFQSKFQLPITSGCRDMSFHGIWSPLK
jgi:hypothetical protein